MMDDDFFKQFRGGFRFGGNTRPPNDKNRVDEFGFDDLDSFFMNDFNRIFDQMDEMMRAMSFGHFDFPEHRMIEFPKNENKNKSLRDDFIKPEKKIPIERRSELVASDRDHADISGSFFSKFFSPENNKRQNKSKIDEDLDEKISKEGFDKVIKEDLFKDENKHTKEQCNTPQFFGFAQSSSVQRIRRPDGSIEEIKTIKTSDGNQEQTRTRIIGDKVHSLIEKKKTDGAEETEEIFQNFDEKNLEDFNKMWNYDKINQSNRIEDSHNIKKIDNKHDNNDDKENKSLVSKLFSWFK